MKIAYIILAHTAPLHLARLVDALTFEQNGIFVHIDAKTDINIYNDFISKRVAILPERVPVHWGDFSQVEAILLLLSTALAHPARYDYFTLLSGVDYPIQPNTYIMDFFRRNAGCEFINMVKMPAPEIGKPISRLTQYFRRPGETAAQATYRDHAKVFGAVAPYAGGTWWSLTRATCERVLAFVSKKPEIVEFYKNTHCPDEGFFQTAVANAVPDAKIRTNLTYADWSTGGRSPSELTDEHLAVLGRDVVIGKSGCGEGEVLFARKFSDASEELVGRLNAITRAKRARVKQ
ncbi:MAG TPA: beta-1,6-N-acetylglucosaminyltransferase [Methylocystis sp.]|nr:beta-1,6-N-acetylglucosaminyltransferase [Methylocystis sp.]